MLRDMGILRNRHNERSLTRAAVKHRHLLEQPDVYFHGPIRFKIDGSYKNCLALLRPGHLSVRDRKNLEKIEATVRLTKGITFHTNGTSIATGGNNGGGNGQSQANNMSGAGGRGLQSKVPEKARLVKFEIHTITASSSSTSTAHGQTHDEEDHGEHDQDTACQMKKYEFKCKSSASRDLWKAYILALSAGISPADCGVHLLPGQVMQIDRLLEMEQKRRSSQRSLPSPDMLRSSTDASFLTGTISHRGRHHRNHHHHQYQDGGGHLALNKSKSAHPSQTAVTTRDVRHKFYKDSAKGTPSYFFEYISREMAEAILTIGHLYGNLLMRRSTSFPNSYALSFRSVLNRNTEIFHYEIGPFKKNNSIDHYFEIKMEGKHPKFKCLNDVVKYFIRLTDGLAKCFTTNDLEILGIKQPPYATHYEPPADYEHRTNQSNKPEKLPPVPVERGLKNHRKSTSPSDPNSEEITVIPHELDEDDDETDTFTGSSITAIGQNTSPASPRLSAAPLTAKAKATPHHDNPANPRDKRRESQVVRFSLGATGQDDGKHAEQKKSEIHQKSPAPVRQSSPFKPITSNSEHLKSNNGQKSDAQKAPLVIPPPPPPPTVLTSSVPAKSAVKKSAILPKAPVSNKGPADRRLHFAPEKNLFRIALECEEEAGKNNVPVSSIQDSNELARQLKGNVKSRVASLEVEEGPGKSAAPNFSRPPKKDFMGELAEKLKLRRQVVEQAC